MNPIPGDRRSREEFDWQWALGVVVALVVGIAIFFFVLKWAINHQPPVESPRAGAAEYPADPTLGADPEEKANLRLRGGDLTPALRAPAPVTLAQSDAALMRDITRHSVAHRGFPWLIPTNVIRHVVATVDALPGRQVPVQALPITPVPGSLIVSRRENDDVISAENGSRYAPYVQALVTISPEFAYGIYQRYFASFEGAYRALGYPRRSFNDRLVEAIDDALAAPLPPSPVRIEAPGGTWRYVDEDLEQCSAGQKIMLRMGPENSQAVREWLRAFRERIAAH